MCPYTAAAIVWPLVDVMFDRGSCRSSFASDAGSALDWGSGGALDLGARPSRFGVSPAVPADDRHAPTSSDVPSRPASTSPSSDISAHAAAATDTTAYESYFAAQPADAEHDDPVDAWLADSAAVLPLLESQVDGLPQLHDFGGDAWPQDWGQDWRQSAPEDRPREPSGPPPGHGEPANQAPMMMSQRTAPAANSLHFDGWSADIDILSIATDDAQREVGTPRLCVGPLSTSTDSQPWCSTE